LRDLDQWATWTRERWRNCWVPAFRTAPTSLAAALAAVERDRLDGIAFVLTADDPYVVIALDPAVDPATGALDRRAERLVAILDSYTERSSGGTGIAIVVRGQTLGPPRMSRGVFIADHEAVVIMTGHSLKGREIAARPTAARMIYERLAALETAVASPPRVMCCGGSGS
jgi:hypothetical protein